MSFRSFGMIMWNQNMVKKQNFMFIVYIEIDVIYRDITEDGGIRFDTSSYELFRSLPKEKVK